MCVCVCFVLLLASFRHTKQSWLCNMKEPMDLFWRRRPKILLHVRTSDSSLELEIFRFGGAQSGLIVESVLTFPKNIN